jgi:fumarate reductase subunit C
MEMVELGTGLFLLGFIQVHLFAVSAIIFSAKSFNDYSEKLEHLGLAQVGIPLVIMAILIHGLVAMRKAPWNVQEARVLLQHSKRLAHLDTWLWVVQILTGFMILVLGASHIASVFATWPINAATSAARVQGGYFSFFSLLILSAEIHGMVGLYRILVKWSWIQRKKFTNLLVYATVFFVALGFLTLFVLYFRKF